MDIQGHQRRQHHQEVLGQARQLPRCGCQPPGARSQEDLQDVVKASKILHRAWIGGEGDSPDFLL